MRKGGNFEALTAEYDVWLAVHPTFVLRPATDSPDCSATQNLLAAMSESIPSTIKDQRWLLEFIDRWDALLLELS